MSYILSVKSVIYKTRLQMLTRFLEPSKVMFMAVYVTIATIQSISLNQFSGTNEK